MLLSSGTVSTPSDNVIMSAMAEKLPVARSSSGCVERGPEGVHERRRLVGAAPVEEPPHQGAADDHAVAAGRRLRGLVGRRDANTQQDGSIGHGVAAPAHL